MSQIDSRSSASEHQKSLHKLLHANLPPRAFWERFLEWAVAATAAEGVMLWKVTGDTLKAEALCGTGDVRAALGKRTRSHVSHVFQAVANDELIVAKTAADSEEPLPARALFALPIHERGEPSGGIECIYPGRLTPDELNQRLKLLEDAIALWEQAQTAPRVDVAEATADVGGGIRSETIIYELHRSLRISQVADVAVNDGRILVGGDRVSIAIKRGRKIAIQAVSGQERVNRRSEEVRSLTSLARAALEVNAPLIYRGTAENLAPRIEELFARHVELTASKQVLVIPLLAPPEKKPREKDDDPRTQPAGIAVGCLIVELFRTGSDRADFDERLSLLADHTGAALGNALAHQNVFLLPLRRALGRGLDWFRGRTLAKTLLVLSAIAAMSLSLAFIPQEYRVEAEGQLLPIEKRRVFAPWDGKVVEVAVASGQKVARGDVLLTLFNDDLHANRIASQNELLEKKQLLLSIQAEIDASIRGNDRKTELQLKGQLEETRIEIAGLQEQVDILVAREQSLTLRAPIDGVVATFQVEELLQNRPVTRGELLLEVMDETQAWRLELQVPEYRMGHLLEALRRESDGRLEVEYVLATDAEATYRGVLTREGLATRSEVSGEDGTVVRVHVETDIEQLPQRRIGAEATGKVNCGERSLGYVLFGDVWEFLQRFFWM